MCGIAGLLDFMSLSSSSRELIQKMTGTLHHRGPDERGYYIDDCVALGHARLSIIDLSGGQQPIHNEDESLWIIYNGEVFNYPELRDELVGQGHTFYTTSDTEVILHLYEQHGASCVQKLNGQFAFAIWDANRKELFLARDRVGIRPLFYTEHKGRLSFASEIKALFADAEVPRELDPASLGQIFTFWTTLPGRTAFKGISELPPGHFLVASESGTRIEKYWSISFSPRGEQLDWDDERICDEVDRLLEDAIRIRLRADVPVGCYVSGGLDSSGIATKVARCFNNRVRTFGIRFEEAAFDEGEYQDVVVKLLGTEHGTLVAGNAGIGRFFEDMIWHAEIPLLRTGPVPLYMLSGLVNRSGFKVVLTGEGADEVFGGYNIFREAKVRRFWSRRPDSEFRKALAGRLYPYIFKDRRARIALRSFLATGLDRVDDPLFSHHVRWNNTGHIRSYFSDDLAAAVRGRDDFAELRETLPAEFMTWEPLARAQYLEMTIFLSNYLLSSQGDRAAMGHSLEIRLPFLDYRLIEFMGTVPAAHKLPGLDEKAILKKVLGKILPPSIVNRTKHPYRAPIAASFLGTNAPPYVDEALSETSLAEAGLFDVKRAQALVGKLRKTETPGERDSMALVGILSTQLLHRKFVADFDPRPVPAGPRNLVIDKRSP
jgi:asparagine synthase (glutamine-hydrolysing)